MRSSLNVEEDGALICTFYTPTEKTWDSQYLYSVRVLKLHGDEFNLNAGRFKQFQFASQKYRVLLSQEQINIQHTWITTWSTAIIGWIAENIDTPWSMKGVPFDMRGANLEFSFDDAVAASHFALQWR